MKTCISVNDVVFIVNLSIKKTPGPYDFNGKFYIYLKN